MSEELPDIQYVGSYIRNAINPKKKKARSKNWSEVQTILLKELIENLDNGKVLANITSAKFTKAGKEAKNKAWLTVWKSFQEQLGNESFTISSLQAKFKNLWTIDKENHDERTYLRKLRKQTAESNRTGGGPPPSPVEGEVPCGNYDFLDEDEDEEDFIEFIESATFVVDEEISPSQRRIPWFMTPHAFPGDKNRSGSNNLPNSSMLIPGASNRAMSTTIAGDKNRSGSINLPNNSMLIPGASNRVMSTPVTGDKNRSESNNLPNNSMLISGVSNRVMSTTIAGDMNRSGSKNLPNSSMLIPGASNRVMSTPIAGDKQIRIQ